jgi:hypothetical protein
LQEKAERRGISTPLFPLFLVQGYPSAWCKPVDAGVGQRPRLAPPLLQGDEQIGDEQMKPSKILSIVLTVLALASFATSGCAAGGDTPASGSTSNSNSSGSGGNGGY